MLHLVRLFLAVFVFFLATPTVVCLVKSSCDTSMAYNMAEEERVVTPMEELTTGETQYSRESFTSADGYWIECRYCPFTS